MAVKITGGKGSTDNTEGSPRSGGTRSHTEGYLTSASGYRSHAEGSGTTASGDVSHVEGSACQSVGGASHAEGTSTYASGTSAHAEGTSTQATGASSHAEGEGSTATGNAGHAEGNYTTASGAAAHSEGASTRATGGYSHAGGNSTTAPRHGQYARGSGLFAAEGDAQSNRFTAHRSTTNATPTVLTFDNGAGVTLTGSTTNVLTIPVNRAHQFGVSAVARRSDVSGDAAGWTFSGLVARDSSGSAAFVGTVDSRAWGAAGAAAWDVTLTIDTTDATNNYLKISVTGEAAKTIRWVARIETVEVG